MIDGTDTREADTIAEQLNLGVFKMVSLSLRLPQFVTLSINRVLC